jgi:hypothetical protein
MTTRANIQGNVAQPGATQINNINFATGMLDPVTDRYDRLKLTDVRSVHRR